VTAFVTHQYQQTFGEKIDQHVNKNLDVLHHWVELRSKMAYEKTESFLIKYCQWLSKSTLFHKMDMTSLLIFLAENQNTTFLHGICIKLLSTIEFPQDVDMEYYLKKCDSNTLIGLARSHDVNLKWFSNEDILPRELTEESGFQLSREIQQLIHDIQSSLENDEDPDSQPQCSTWLFQKVINEHLPDEPIPNLMNDLSTGRDHHSLSHEKTDVLSTNILFDYLKILRQFTANDKVSSNPDLSASVLNVVRNIVAFYDDEGNPDRKSVLEKCGNIVANLSCTDANREAVIQRGYLPLFMNWKSSTDNTLKIVADRALTNLDFQTSVKKLCDGIYVLHPNCRSADEAIVDVVFVHGIQGSPFHTWRQRQAFDQAMYTDCWPKDWLPEDYPNIRVIGVHYESFFSDWYSSCPVDNEKRSLENKAIAIKEKLKEFGVGERPIVWVTHSLGGLITKRMLSLSNSCEDTSNFLSSTKGLVFYSVPHLGSPFATTTGRARFVLFPSKEVSEIEENAEGLKKLHQDFSELARKFKIECLDFGESKPYKLPYVQYAQVIVPSTSSNVGYGRFMLLDSNHQDVCKPVNKVDPRYWEVSAMIRRVLQENEKTEDNELFKSMSTVE